MIDFQKKRHRNNGIFRTEQGASRVLQLRLGLQLRRLNRFYCARSCHPSACAVCSCLGSRFPLIDGLNPGGPRNTPLLPDRLRTVPPPSTSAIEAALPRLALAIHD